MTNQARSLGMRRTTFRNASGLPDNAQVTSARDMAILGLALQNRYPHYFKYFATKSFKWKGKTYSNHNRRHRKGESGREIQGTRTDGSTQGSRRDPAQG